MRTPPLPRAPGALAALLSRLAPVLLRRSVLGATLLATTLLATTLVATTLLAMPVAAAQPLTPEEALARALGASPSIRAADADVRGADARLRAAVGARLPVLVVGVDGRQQERFAGTASGVTRNADGAVGGRVALRYVTELGTELQIGLDGGASWRSVNLTPGTIDSVTIGPIYSTQATIDARQPLLRGAGDDAALGLTREAEAGRVGAQRGRDQTHSQLALEVLQAYWELWYAQRVVDVQREALAVANRQLDEQRLRVERLGTIAPADLATLSVQRASIQEALALAESARRTRAIALARLMAADLSEATSLEAAADPPELAAPRPLPELARGARASSTELLALAAQVDQARQRVRVAANADRPRLDLVGSVGMGGLWNDVTLGNFQLPGGRPAFGGLLGLELELPLGSSQAEAEHDEARAVVDAAEARYEARQAELVAELATLREQATMAAEQLGLASETARLAREAAEAEAARLALGTTTPFALISAQQAQRESELRRLRAIVDRLSADLGLRHRTGELLTIAGVPEGRS